MGSTRTDRLDALLGPMLELEARLRRDDDGSVGHVLDEAHVHLLREAHDLRIDSDECEIFLATDAPIDGRPGDPFERDA